MTPIQFQKLQTSRSVEPVISKSSDATDVAFRVEYESKSQFSREYSLLFGLPPKEDIKRLRGIYSLGLRTH